ncbi:hypothetical protein IWW45_009528, partial [Coemansia sp. RSA 485]
FLEPGDGGWASARSLGSVPRKGPIVDTVDDALDEALQSTRSGRSLLLRRRRPASASAAAWSAWAERSGGAVADNGRAAGADGAHDGGQGEAASDGDAQSSSDAWQVARLGAAGGTREPAADACSSLM